MKAQRTTWRPAESESDLAREVQALRRTLRDVVALSTLPSVWVEGDLPRSIKNFADVLRAALRASTVCVRVELPDGSEYCTAASDGLSKLRAPHWDAGELLDAIDPDTTELVEIPRFNGSGPLNILPRPLFFDGRQIGCLAACYESDVLPSDYDSLLLQTAASQIALLFQRHQDQEERLARQVAEDRLRQAEHHYQQLVQSLPAAVYTCDTEGRITLYNEAAAKLWGRRPKLGKDMWCGSWKIFKPDGSPLPLKDCPMAVAIREGRSVRGEEIIVERPDGTRAWVLPHPDPIRNEAGTIVGTVNMLVQVDDLKRAEQAARANEARIHSLLTLMPAAVFACDAEGRITFYNRRAVELWGSEPKLNDSQQKFCAAYKCWFGDKVLRPEETPMAVAVKEGKAFRNLEPVFERPDGEKFSVLVNIDPLFDAAGKPAGAINVFQDVTPLRRAQEELKSREEHLRTVVENTPECVKLVAEDGTLLAMNGAGLCMIEADSAEHVIGTNVYDVIAPEYRDAFRAMNERVCAGSKERLEFEIIGLKGTRRWMETHAAPIVDPASGRTVQIAVTRNITERRSAELELRRHQSQIEAELADSKLLQSISTEVVSESNMEALHEKLVDAAAAIMRSDFSSMQMYCPERGSGELLLLALRGFGPEAAQTWKWVSRESPSSCGEALRRGERVIGTDVEKCEFLGSEGLAAYRAAGIGSMQSTPLFSRSGELVGMLSTHWRKPHEPSERELRLFDILARLAADVIERRRAERLVQQSNALFESQKNAFQAAMRGSSLEESLEVLVRHVIEATGGRARAAFYVARPDGKALRHVIGMPEHYAKAVDNFPISAESMACGLAVHTGRPEIAVDVEQHPKWESYRWLARHHNFRACWSFPVRTRDSVANGTLAMYFQEPCAPTPRELEMAAVVAHAATVIISRHQQLAERERAELALRETNERLQKVLEIETVGVMFWDLTTGCLVDANDAFLKMMGYSREDVESRALTWEKFTPPEYHDISRAEIAKFMVSGRVGPYEKEYFHKDGTRRWLLFAGSSLGNNQCVEFCVDIAERKKAEQALRESEERYRATFENAGVGIAHVGLDGRWLRFNDAVCAISGYAREELERMTFADITHPEDVERDWQHARKLMAGEIPRYAIEKRYIRKDGAPVWVMLTVSLMRDAGGRPMHFVSVIENIDEKKQARQILEQTVTERTASLREAVEQMEEFSYSVSHDLRGPLRAMSAYAGVLLEEYGTRLDGTARGYLERIQRSSERMNRLTQDVLAYSRVARAQAQLEPIDLERLVRDVIHQHTSLQPPAAEIEIVGPLPAVLGHETTLGQSVSNLLNNAVKFVAPEVKPHIRIRAESNAKYVRVWFEDNGIGIKPEHQKRIFNMFERVHPDSKYDGTGIGLTIVRKAMEKMGGKVGVDSDGHKGSRFWIELRQAE